MLHVAVGLQAFPLLTLAVNFDKSLNRVSVMYGTLRTYGSDDYYFFLVMPSGVVENPLPRPPYSRRPRQLFVPMMETEGSVTFVNAHTFVHFVRDTSRNDLFWLREVGYEQHLTIHRCKICSVVISLCCLPCGRAFCVSWMVP